MVFKDLGDLPKFGDEVWSRNELPGGFVFLV